MSIRFVKNDVLFIDGEVDTDGSPWPSQELEYFRDRMISSISQATNLPRDVLLMAPGKPSPITIETPDERLRRITGGP